MTEERHLAKWSIIIPLCAHSLSTSLIFKEDKKSDY